MQNNQPVYFNIGGMTFAVRADLGVTDKTFHHQMLKYRSVCPGEDIIHLHHHFSLPPFEEVGFGRPVYRYGAWAFYRAGAGWVYREEDPETADGRLSQLAFFNAGHTEGEIYHPGEEAYHQGVLNSLSFRSTDQILFAQLLAARQGCILHSSALQIAGQGFLFLGHSGAGKSTILDLLKDEGQVIGEDRNILRRQPDGWQVYGFFHHRQEHEVTAGPAPLRALFLLEQASETRLIPLTNRLEVVRRLLPLVIKAMVTADWWEKTLDVVEKIADEVPVYRLLFEKKGRVKELLRELL